jgi:UDP-glucose 4-epimerase
MDLQDESSIRSAVHGVTTIIHLAALNDLECAENPEQAHKFNVGGTERLLNAAIAAGVKRIVYMSTIHVYGAPLLGLISESSPTNPSHPYGVTHLLAENAISAAHTKGLIEGVVLRSANGFGVPMDPAVKIWQILVNDLCKQAVETGTLRLISDGSHIRNFLPLVDLCGALRHAQNLSASALGDGIFNVGSPKSSTVLEMANIIVERCSAVLGFTPDLVLGPTVEEKVKPSPLNYDCSKLAATGFVAATPPSFEVDRLLLMCQQVFGQHV